MPEDKVDQLEELKNILNTEDGVASFPIPIYLAIKNIIKSKQLSLAVLKQLSDKQRHQLVFTLLDMFHKFNESNKEKALRECSALLQEIMKTDPALLSQMNHRGFFPLMYAVRLVDFKLVSLLMQCGANPKQTYCLDTPMEYAIRYKQKNPVFLNQLKTIEQFNTRNQKHPKESLRHYIIRAFPFLGRFGLSYRYGGAQQYLQTLGNLLGYTNDPRGICHSVAHMGMQAFLLSNDREESKGLKEFDDRVSKIKEVSTEKHLKNVEHAREKMKKREKLTPDEEIALELPAFYEGIEVYLAKRKNKALLHEKGKAPVQYEPEPLLALTMPAELERKDESISSVRRFSGVYNEDEMKTYFSTLFIAAKAANVPFALALATNHAITVGVNSKGFYLINANNLPTKYYQTADDITKAVRHAFDFGVDFGKKVEPEDRFVVETTLFSLSSHKEPVNTMCDSWMQEMQDINRVTSEKANFQDIYGNTWIRKAILTGDIDTYNDLTKKRNFFRKDFFYLNLLFSLSIGAIVAASYVGILGIGMGLAIMSGVGTAIIAGGILKFIDAQIEKHHARHAREAEMLFIHKINISRSTPTDKPAVSPKSSTQGTLMKIIPVIPRSSSSTPKPTEAGNDLRFPAEEEKDFPNTRETRNDNSQKTKTPTARRGSR